MSQPNDPASPATPPPVVPKKFLFAFILVTLLFPLWGFANDITNPMVAAFKKILLLTNFQSSLVQGAFYGGYAFMAIPAALFIKKFSYKSGILVGLTLYSLAALFFPVAGMMMSFPAFLIAFFVMTCGLSFLETTSNPYILSMGDPATATRRLNLSQAFNPMGSLVGMFVAMTLILGNLVNVRYDAEIAPDLAKNAQEQISQIVSSKDSDAAKWDKINELNLTSWVAKSDDIAKGLKENSPIKWDAILSATKTTHERLAKALPVVENDKTTDSEKWAALKSQQLTSTLKPADLEKIETLLSKNKEIDWANSGVLDGSPNEEQARRLIAQMDTSKWTGIQKQELEVLQGPYFAIGIVVAIFLVIFIFSKLPASHAEEDKSLHLAPTLKRLFGNSNYVFGVVAQAFYVGAQIMCWTYIIQYAGNELGMRPSTAQGYNIVAMIVFVSSRFICTFLLKYVSPGSLLAALATGGAAFVAGAIFIPGMTGLYSLMAVSACMSLMFPTIYGIALDGLGDDAKLGAAGLILAIGGGCAMPLFQGKIMDMDAFNLGSYALSSTRASFVLPFICFIVIVLYGIHAHKKHISE